MFSIKRTLDVVKSHPCSLQNVDLKGFSGHHICTRKNKSNTIKKNKEVHYEAKIKKPRTELPTYKILQNYFKSYKKLNQALFLSKFTK